MQFHHLPKYTLLLAGLLCMGLALSGCEEDSKLQVNRLSRTTGIPGDVITFHGAGFQSGGVKNVRVYFEGREAKVLRIQGNDEIKVEAPGGIEMGTTVDIKMIFEPGGEITLEKAFKYVEPSRSTVDDLVEAKDEK